MWTLKTLILCFFFFNDTATTEIYTLSLHDALPICEDGPQRHRERVDAGVRRGLRPLRQVRVRPRQGRDRAPVDAGLGRALVAVRAGGARVRAGGQRPRRPDRAHQRLRRGSLDDRGRDGQGRAHAGHHREPLRPVLQPRERRLHAQDAVRAARAVRGARRHALGVVTATATENPLTEGLERLPVSPTTLVIFGATGDLARRKLLPALYNLAHEGALPGRFNLIGVSRSELSDDEFRE